MPESTTYVEYDDAYTTDYTTEGESLTEKALNKEVLTEKAERRVAEELTKRTKNNVDEKLTGKVTNRVVEDNKTESIDDGRNEVEYKDKEGEPVDGADHPCYRKCESGKTMECIYKFEIEWYQSMSKACYDCPFNATDCDRLDCIAADGVSRPLTVINRKMPGPSVQVGEFVFFF